MTADLHIERRVAGSPETCFDLWTDPAQLARWWGPTDEHGRPFAARVDAWLARPGAAWAITMTAPDGSHHAQAGRMLEVRRPDLPRFSFAWVTPAGSGPETEVRVEFRPDGAGTLVIFAQAGFADAETRDAHRWGWERCLDRLVAAGEA